MYRKINRRDFMRWIWHTGLYSSLYSIMCQSKLAHADPWAYIYRENEAALITFTSHPESVHKMVPKPLKANDKGIMVASFASMHKVEPVHAKNDYLLSSLGIPVVYEAKRGFGLVRIEGLFYMEFYSDSETPVSFARRTYGYPSKKAKMSWLANKNKVKSSVTKNDEQVARVEMNISNKGTDTQPGSDTYHFNLVKGTSFQELAITKCRYEEQERIPGQVVEANLFGINIESFVSTFYRKYDFYIPSGPQIVAKIPRQ